MPLFSGMPPPGESSQLEALRSQLAALGDSGASPVSKRQTTDIQKIDLAAYASQVSP